MAGSLIVLLMSDLIDRLREALGDRYAIEKEVGTGGMATVFLSRDLKHERKVALKVLKPELTAVLGAERFPREIRIAAQFNHPHIVSVYDSGEREGFLYYVMPFVEGESLRQRLEREGPLRVGEAIRILREVLDALAYAHAHGIVHRDIKPDNVMLSGRHAVVADFGVAKAVSSAGRETLTTVGIAVGTPKYMAPEQAMGEADIDHRVDIYAVGALGYEMLSGKPPFEGSTAQAVLSAHVMDEPPDLRDRRPDVPAPLAEALKRCLAKDPDDRWRNAEDLLAQLEAIAVTPSGGVTPTQTRPVKATPVRRKRSRGLWIGGIVTLLLIGGAAGGFLLTRSGHRGIRRIGVLPIQDVSGKDAVFVAALQDALTNGLARLGRVGVASRATMMSYSGKSVPTKSIADEQNLDAVVEASVFRADTVMRIDVEFEDPETTRILWSNVYERNVSDVLQAQADLVDRISAAVDSVLSGTGSDSRAGASG